MLRRKKVVLDINKKHFTYNQRFILLSMIPIYFMLIGLLIQTPRQIFKGLIDLITGSDILITDYFEVGGPGAAFVNAGILTLLLIAIHYFAKMDFNGHTVTSCCMMFGFSLFGKNIFNIWLILMGIFIYAWLHGVSIKKYLYVGCYGTCLSPIITQVMHVGHLAFWQQIILSIVTGLIIGYVLLPIAMHTVAVHKGFSLYNVGFAAGIIATIIASIFKSFGITIETRLLWSKQYNEIFMYALPAFFILLIGFAIATGKKELVHEYKLLLKHSGIKSPDFVEKFSDFTVLFNMGINGLFATFFVIFVKGDLNGPIIGSIFTIVGFSATGKHLRNIAPVMFGVFIASALKLWVINDPAPLMTLILSTTLAPIAGEFGIAAGIVAGFLHSSVALNVGIVYSGMNLYNNGFAGGIIALFMVPVIEAVIERRKFLMKENGKVKVNR